LLIAMRLSTDRILVSHTGNLPRPATLDRLIDHGQGSTPAPRLVDHYMFHQRLPRAVEGIVERQIELGIDVVNDGEYVKAGSYGGYIHERLSGFEWQPYDPMLGPKRAPPSGRDALQFPAIYDSGLWYAGAGGPIRPGFMTPGNRPPEPTQLRVCSGPVRYTGQSAIAEDIRNLQGAIADKPVEGFLSALGPLSVGAALRNEYYKDEETYLMSVAEALREEYRAITDAGLIVQIDEPEFATSWQFYPEWTLAELRAYLGMCVEVINHSLDGLPEELIRFHFCWASPHRPHVNDIELRHIIDLLVKIRAQSYAFEAANVRHDHEWDVWKDVNVPDNRILMPGVITHSTDLVEHPRLVANRLKNYASIVGRERVQAGTDCGMGSRVGHEDTVWAKFATMAEGARIASDELWP
jgi:5-methyltetrahydropteroyltriglutamate--homocysteine methyltransferase